MKFLNTMKLLITVYNHKSKIESYCVKCKKYTKNINPGDLGTSNGKEMILSKCATCGSKKSRSIKKKKKRTIK